MRTANQWELQMLQALLSRETQQQSRWGSLSPGVDQQGFIQGGSGNTKDLGGGAFGAPQGGGHNKHALKVPP